jgi:HK97 family phage major capsid protein
VSTLRALLERRAAIAGELRKINAEAGDNDLNAEQRARFDELKTDLDTLEQRISRQTVVDDAERRMQGQPLGGTGDRNLDAELRSVGVLDVVRAAMGGTDRTAGLATELSAELARRSGRNPQGLYWHMGGQAEQRVLTTAAPAGGPGSNLVATDHRADLFIDRLRASTRVRSLGATVLTGLMGNVSIPRRKASSTAAWVAENAAITPSDPEFDAVSLTPKHAGAITEWSRNMIMQTSPDVEQLARNDLSLILAEALDLAAINGTGADNQPLGILGTSGIGAVAMGTDGGPITWAKTVDLIAEVEIDNASGTGFLTNSRVVKSGRKTLKVADDAGAGFIIGDDGRLAGQPLAVTNLVPSNLTKGSSSGVCSALIYGNWSDLLIGLWSELDILVNPFESSAYAKGNVSIRAMMTCDIDVRQPASFAAIKDLTTP